MAAGTAQLGLPDVGALFSEPQAAVKAPLLGRAYTRSHHGNSRSVIRFQPEQRVLVMMICIAALFGGPKPPDSAKALANLFQAMGLSRPPIAWTLSRHQRAEVSA
jgi:hypothetical protein